MLWQQRKIPVGATDDSVGLKTEREVAKGLDGTELIQ